MDVDGLGSVSMVGIGGINSMLNLHDGHISKSEISVGLLHMLDFAGRSHKEVALSRSLSQGKQFDHPT